MCSTDLPIAAKRHGPNHVRLGRRILVNFAGCDYFRLSSNPKVLAAVQSGLRRHGLNVAASRKTTGNHELYAQLETELAKFFGAEAAVVGSTGYLANLAVAQALAGEFTHALIDARAHASLGDAARHLDCPGIEFSHRDAASLQARLRSLPGSIRPLVLTDGLFAHDGSVAPLQDYLKILPRRGMILVDDAHGAGVLGKTGQGTLEFLQVGRERVIQTGTLSKAFGVYGGVILGSRELRRKILARSKVFAGSTPFLLPLANAARAALGLIGNASMRSRLLENTNLLKGTLRTGGWAGLQTPGPVVQYIPTDSREARGLERALVKAGIYAPLIKYAEWEGGYFRFAIASEHVETELAKLAKVLLTTCEAQNPKRQRETPQAEDCRTPKRWRDFQNP